MSLFIYSLLPLVATPCIVLVAQTAVHLHNRRSDALRAKCIGDIISLICAPHELHDSDIEHLHRRYPYSVLRDATLFVADNIYGDELYRLSSIIEICGVDYHLIRTLQRYHGTRRAKALKHLSHLPLTPAIFEVAESHIDEERHISFYATAALIASRPEHAVRYITRLRYDLSLYEAAWLVELMRRRGSIAYTPLLNSENRNLQLLGIYVVASLTAVDAEPTLQHLLSDTESRLALHSLYTLCALRGNITSGNAKRLFGVLEPHHRKAFIRHAVQSCYSSLACSALLDSDEQTSLLNRINSYKCRIVCN